MVTKDFWADINARIAEHQARAAGKVNEMEAAGYTVVATHNLHTCRITVTSLATHKHCNPSGRVTDKPDYREHTSAAAGHPFAVDAAYAKWRKHREVVAS